VVFVADWNPDIPAEIVEKITAVQATILDGSFSPFTGPLTNQDGAEAVAAGVVLGDDKILSMDWHVKGVTTPLPK
jgi:basic membrane lipoprotein Med (substrate-binding protein (PBP1-ABC) superfamily)